MSEQAASANPDITITLPLNIWQIVMAHLGRGAFNEVAVAIYLIGEQSTPQVLAAASRVKVQEAAPDPSPTARNLN